MRTNYHTHHDRCRHASGTVEDYVKEAIRQQYDEIGISCHVPYENLAKFQSTRMRYGELGLYFNDIDTAQAQYPQIRILKSLECEYFPEVHDYMKGLYETCDYLILGQHYIDLDGKTYDAFSFTDPRQLREYGKTVIRALKTGFYKILAHPDVFMTSYPKWDSVCDEVSRRIIEAAIRLEVLLEVNANGYRRGKRKYKDGVRYPYPSENFWHLVAKEYPHAKVIVGSDCHNPEFLDDEFMEKAREFAARIGLNVMESL